MVSPVAAAAAVAPLNPILNTVASIFDDKMAVVNAGIRGSTRGAATPLLLELVRKPNFPHDNAVLTMDARFNWGAWPQVFCVDITRLTSIALCRNGEILSRQ